MKAYRSRSITSARSRANQRGLALFFALIALVVISLACVSLVRSVDTVNVIVGNFAFRHAGVQASDVGIETAFTALPNIITTSHDTDIPNQYYATQIESRGAIPPLDWTTVFNWGAVPTTTVGGNSVQYVIERLCSGTLPVTDIQANCVHEQAAANGSNKSGATVFSSSTAIYYRVTVRVAGPRNTVALTQAILSY